MGLSLTFCCLLFGIVYTLEVSNVEVDISTTFRSLSCELPDTLTVRLDHDNDTTTLQLQKVEELGTDVFLLRHSGDGGATSTVVPDTSGRTESEVSVQYQDATNVAAITGFCSMENGSRVLYLEGSLTFSDGKHYFLRRSAEKNGTYIFESEKEGPQTEDRLDFVVDPDLPLADIDTTNRVTLPDVYIDVVLLLEYSVYQRWLSRSNGRSDAIRRMKRHFAHMMNAINLRYKTASSHINIVLAGYVIEDQGSGEWFDRVRHTDSFYQGNTIDGQRLLTSVWQMTSSTSGFPKNDHVLTFTAYDMRTAGSTGNYNLLGIAYMQSVCRDGGRSVSVVEYTHRFTDDMLVATHEIGHGLSSQHDGTNNVCGSTDRYIMAPSYNIYHNSYNNNPHLFSQCSTQYIKSYINYLLQFSSAARCLKTKYNAQDVPDVGENPDEDHIDINKQCQLRHGPQSYFCKSFADASTCKQLPCYNPSTRACSRHSPPDGTPCGGNKRCRLGKCQFIRVNPAVTPKPCSKVCKNGGSLNKRTCVCNCADGYTGEVCDTCSRKCPSGQLLMSRQCVCVKVPTVCSKVCKNGGTLNKEACSCRCSGGFTGATCGTCQKRCPTGQQLSASRCTCVKAPSVCRRRCVNGGVLNSSTCTCRCSQNYYGQTCERCSTRCGRGLRLKQGSCRCIPEACWYRESQSCRFVSSYKMCQSYSRMCPWTCRMCCEYPRY